MSIDEYFNDIEKRIRAFERQFDELMTNIWNTPETGNNVKSFGFKIYMDNTMDKPIIETFGNIDPKDINFNLLPSGKTIDEKEGYMIPYTEVNFNKDNATYSVLVELPGIDKNQIKLKATEHSVKIQAESDKRKYMKEIPLKQAIKPKDIKARFKNGILELTVPIRDADAFKETEINIE